MVKRLRNLQERKVVQQNLLTKGRKIKIMRRRIRRKKMKMRSGGRHSSLTGETP